MYAAVARKLVRHGHKLGRPFVGRGGWRTFDAWAFLESCPEAHEAYAWPHDQRLGEYAANMTPAQRAVAASRLAALLGVEE